MTFSSPVLLLMTRPGCLLHPSRESTSHPAIGQSPAQACAGPQHMGMFADGLRSLFFCCENWAGRCLAVEIKSSVNVQVDRADLGSNDLTDCRARLKLQNGGDSLSDTDISFPCHSCIVFAIYFKCWSLTTLAISIESSSPPPFVICH